MAGQRFDDLVKQLGTKRLSRVSMLRGGAGGDRAAPTGAKVGTTQTAEAQGTQAQCKGEGSICEGGPDKCCAGFVCNGLENPTK